jgi:hypothetical protein
MTRDEHWTHHMLGDAAELEATPPQMKAAKAQPWSNFIVFTPSRLPAGTHLVNQTLRREAPPGRVGDSTVGRTPWTENNPAAFRFELAGEDRRLRVKQFLYDWAFPALDHPALWQSHTTCDGLNEHHIVWHGVDYMGHPGASARLARTMIELSVLDGTFTREEITEIYRSLRPADPAAARAITATPFAALSYWARRPGAPVISVPLGIWNIQQPDTMTMAWQPGAGDPAAAGGLLAPPALGSLAIDSTAIHTGPTPIAREFLYSGGPDRGRELRLHQLAPSHLPGRIDAEPHPSRQETLDVNGHHVRLGFIEAAHGPFDAIIADHEGQPSWRLLSSADATTNREWFLDVLTELLRSVTPTDIGAARVRGEHAQHGLS